MLNYLYNRFGKDKVLHFNACALIALLVGCMLLPFANIFVVMFSAFMTASAAALAKEYGDKCSPTNRWDWNDVIADYAGTFTGLIIVLIIYML